MFALSKQFYISNIIEMLNPAQFGITRQTRPRDARGHHCRQRNYTYGGNRLLTLTSQTQHKKMLGSRHD
jgi:hypothetical protein